MWEKREGADIRTTGRACYILVRPQNEQHKKTQHKQEIKKKIKKKMKIGCLGAHRPYNEPGQWCHLRRRCRSHLLASFLHDLLPGAGGVSASSGGQKRATWGETELLADRTHCVLRRLWEGGTALGRGKRLPARWRVDSTGRQGLRLWQSTWRSGVNSRSQSDRTIDWGRQPTARARTTSEQDSMEVSDKAFQKRQKY